MPDGPYLQTAVLCERALREQDGSVSLIRLASRIAPEWGMQISPSELVDPGTGEARPATDEERSSQLFRMERLPLLSLAVMFTSGDARGTYSVQVNITGPDGESRGSYETDVEFADDPVSGAGIVTPFDLQGRDFQVSPGVYWLEVVVEGRSMTKFPLTVSAGDGHDEP
jgi:hypothetical protein